VANGNIVVKRYKTAKITFITLTKFQLHHYTVSRILLTITKCCGFLYIIINTANYLIMIMLATLQNFYKLLGFLYVNICKYDFNVAFAVD